MDNLSRVRIRYTDPRFADGDPDPKGKSVSNGSFGGNGQRDRRDSGKVIDQHNHHHQDNKNQNRNQMQNNNQNRGWMNRGNNNHNMRGNRGRGRMHQSNFQRDQNINFRQGANNNKGRAKNPLKFDQDYDFEQANNQFEELRSQLDKLKVTDEPKAENQTNGETDKKDDSGNETGAGDHEPEEEGVGVVGYDKSKSLFDNVSYEAATDRTKGKNRTDWRQELKLNSEAFGLSSTRRGNYRSRGGYYNRNMSMHGGGDGGYRGYRGGNNYRGRNNNNNNNRGGQQRSTGLPNSKNPNRTQQPNNQSQASIQSQQTLQQAQQPPAAAAAGN